MKRIIIIGATSGLGYKVAELYLEKGWMVGVAGRRDELLEEFKKKEPQRVFTKRIDVTSDDAPNVLREFISELGGMDVFLNCSGMGRKNLTVERGIEVETVATNVKGFTAVLLEAFDFFKEQGYGHLAVISSVSGTRGLGVAPSYSATKAFQQFYMQALTQNVLINGFKKITFTDIRPGFVATDFINETDYPLVLSADKVAKKIVKAIDKKKRVATIDWKFSVIVFVWRLLPRALWEKLKITN